MPEMRLVATSLATDRKTAVKTLLATLLGLLTVSPAAGQNRRPLPATETLTFAVGEAGQSFTLSSRGGELVAVRVEQRGVDVTVEVWSPDGSRVARMDTPGGAWAPEAAIFRSVEPGTYRLDVRPRERERGPGASAAAETSGDPQTIRLVLQQPLAPTADGRAQQVLDAWAEASHWPGGPGAVAAVVRGGTPIASAAYGLAILEHGLAMNTQTVLDIGSVSKEFTDFALVLLAARAKLGLDDDIRLYLPEVPDFGTPIRIRNLVHHTSGLREVYNALALAGWQPGDGIAQEEALALVTRSRDLNFEPGSEYLYCNTGYMLLADIVARASGRPFDRFMGEEVFGPLGMDHTTIMAEKGQVMWGAAESYAPTDDGGWLRVYDNSSIQGAGGIYTTVADLARWLHNFRSAAVGGTAAIDQMQERGVLSGGDTLPYAFGLNVGRWRGLRTLSHGGSSAGYRASLLYFPDYDVGIVTQANSPATAPAQLPPLLAEAMLGEMAEASPPTEETPSEASTDATRQAPTWTPTPAELGTLEGTYWSPELETAYTLRLAHGRLTAHHARHGSLELTPQEPDRFSGPYPLDEVRVARGPGGAITGLRVTNGRVRGMWFARE